MSMLDKPLYTAESLARELQDNGIKIRIDRIRRAMQAATQGDPNGLPWHHAIGSRERLIKGRDARRAFGMDDPP